MVKRVVLFLLLGVVFQVTWAKTKGWPRDTVQLYRNLETLADKNRTTRFVHSLLLKPVDSTLISPSTNRFYIPTSNYNEYEGKIIRKITIETLDPFGKSILLRENRSQNFIYDVGDILHIKTMRLTIRNLLLFKEKQPLDSLLLRESERLIRGRNYVQDIAFQVLPVGNGGDSVDVFIREVDLWTLMPRVYIASSHTTFKVTEKNIAGTGHEFQAQYIRSYANEDPDGYAFRYTAPNIHNSFIDFSASTSKDIYQNRIDAVGFERSFFSGISKWAGGASLSLYDLNDSVFVEESGYLSSDKAFTLQDYWGGLSFHPFGKKSYSNRVTGVVFAGRYTSTRYNLKPDTIVDPDQIFSNEDVFLGSFGVSSPQYEKAKYIQNFGFFEDIPVGFAASCTGGYQYKNKTERLYLGGRIGYGSFFNWGYMSAFVEYGSFFRALNSEQMVYSLDLHYFSNLFMLGSWRFRQFVHPQMVIGVNRFSNESIPLNGDLIGFSGALNGTKRFELALLTQSYAPVNFYGFRFGPYFKGAFGMLGDSTTDFKHSRVYSQFTLGCLIKNEFLVFDSFQISLTYYPVIPGSGTDIFKANINGTREIDFPDFMIGKPNVAVYK